MITQFSYSALSTFSTCPRKFKFSRIDKVRVPKRVTADAYLGNAVHRQLERAYVLAADGHLYPLEKMLADFLAEWDKPQPSAIEVPNENLGVDDYIESGKKMLTTFYHRYQAFNHGTLIGSELNISFPFPGTDCTVRTRIDRVMKYDDGVVEIADYKTGRTLPLGPQAPSFRNQMGLYQLAVQTTYPQFETIELSQYWLRQDETIRARWSVEELDEFTEQVRQQIVAVRHAARLDDFPTSESNMCNYCEFFSLCPAKRHRLALEREAGTTDDEMASFASASELADKYIQVDDTLVALKAEKDALREELINLSAELALNVITGDAGAVTVKTRPEEKFPTRSGDPERFAALAHLAREMGFEEFFQLNEKQLMKDIYQKKKLSEADRDRLTEFVHKHSRSDVRIRRKKPERED